MIDMSQIFTIHEPRICEICKEPMEEMQVGRFSCLCCGSAED